MSARSAKSLAAEAAFRGRLAELGAELLEPAWLGSGKPHAVRCVAGHLSRPRPSDLQRGQGICITCAGQDPAVAEAAFRAGLAELGATLLEPRWLGSGRPHRVRCAAGHEISPRPSNLRKGQGICWQCSLAPGARSRKADSLAAEAKFRDRLAELGATLLEEAWLGNDKQHRVRCAAGHACTPTPGSVIQGRGVCITCAGHDPAVGEATFRKRLAELGATLLEPKYLGANKPHRIRCANGHECRSRPNDLQQGGGICRTCAGQDPAVAEAAFRARVMELGGVVLGPYVNKDTGVLIRCREGHESPSRPGDIRAGDGICRACSGKAWDVFYVVTSPLVVKFGITTGDPRSRLADHAHHGYTTVVRLLTSLPGTAAPDTENAIKAALSMAGERPIRGKEYFDIACLGLILDVADSWLGRDDAAA